MKVMGFKCEIKYISYKKFEDKYVKTDVFTANAIVAEVGRGQSKSKQLHNVIFYINKEQYEEQSIEVGDIVEVYDGAKWKCHVIEWKNKGNAISTSFKNKIFSYMIQCKEEDYCVEMKWYEKYYCVINGTRIKLPLDSEAQFESDNLEFILDDKEIETVTPFNGKEVRVLAYKKKNKFAEKLATVVLGNNEETGANLLLREVREV